jgi:hypothetical protein
MQARSIKGTSPEEIKQALEGYLKTGFKPTLAFVFISVKQDIDTVRELLEKERIAIYGATTGGEFVDGKVGKESIAILLLDMHPACFQIFIEDAGREDTRNVAKKMTEHATTLFSNPAFIVSGSGMSTDAEMIVRGIEDAAGTDATIFGGMAGDDFQMQDTFVFTHGKSSSQGIILLVIDADKVDIKGMATCGWKPQGTVKTITSAEGPWIHTIDEQPALDMMVKYMGITSERKEKIDAKLLELGADYPLQFQREDRDPVMKPIMYFNWEDRSVMVGGNVKPGSKIRFSVPPDFEVIDQVIEDCKKVKEEALKEADAVIIFECAGRLVALGPLVGNEIEGIKNTYDVPMAGFFTYGEFGKTMNGNHEAHNFTCCWVALKEKED